MSPVENSGWYREECAMLEGGKEGSHGLCVGRVEKRESFFQTNIIKKKSKSQCLQRSP